MKKEDKKLIISMIVIIIIACIFFTCLTYFNNNISLADYNPFPEMRKCEERHEMNGILYAVDFVDCGYNCDYTLIVFNDNDYHFKSWDYADFKKYEGQKINIVYFSNCQTSEYYLDALRYDWIDEGGIKPFSYKNGG